jgi:hypothetical protein
MSLAWPVSRSTMFRSNSGRAYCWQHFKASFPFRIPDSGRANHQRPPVLLGSQGLREPGTLSTACRNRSWRRRNLPAWPIISFTPALAARLTRPPKEWHLRMHITQPFPYLLQFAGGPAVPVVSMNTSPSTRKGSSPCLPETAAMRFSFISTSVILAWQRISIPFGQKEFLHHGLHFRHIVKRSVMVARKFNVPVKAVLIGEIKQLPAPHGPQLFGGCEPAVVSHDPAHEAGAQQHIRALQEHDLGALACGPPMPPRIPTTRHPL